MSNCKPYFSIAITILLLLTFESEQAQAQRRIRIGGSNGVVFGGGGGLRIGGQNGVQVGGGQGLRFGPVNSGVQIGGGHGLQIGPYAQPNLPAAYPHGQPSAAINPSVIAAPTDPAPGLTLTLHTTS